MSSQGWENELHCQNPEGYDSDINDYQPDNSNPHTRSFEEDLNPEKYINEALEHTTSEFDEKELSKAELYQNAMNISEMLTERFNEGNGYTMVEFGPEGANAVIIADGEQMKVDNAYDPSKFESTFNPFEYLDNTEYANRLRFQIINAETWDLSIIDMTELEEEWTISNNQMAQFSETIMAAPGLEEPYSEMLQEETGKIN